MAQALAAPLASGTERPVPLVAASRGAGRLGHCQCAFTGHSRSRLDEKELRISTRHALVDSATSVNVQSFGPKKL